MNSVHRLEDRYCATWSENVDLAFFMNDGGDFDYKVQKLIDMGVDTVRLSTCMRGKNNNS